MVYIQVGGCADGAADAAPSHPSAVSLREPRQGSTSFARCARGRRTKRTPQRANKPKTGQKARRRRGIAAEPLGDCRVAFRRLPLSLLRFYPRLLCSAHTRRAFNYPSAMFACKYSRRRLLRIWIYFSVTPRSAAYAFCVFALTYISSNTVFSRFGACSRAFGKIFRENKKKTVTVDKSTDDLSPVLCLTVTVNPVISPYF